jgi:uncharacterized RDD family membrane protein YckC
VAEDGAVSDLPSYPREAAEREEVVGPAATEHVYAGWWSRVGAYLLDALLLAAPLIVVLIVAAVVAGDEEGGIWAVVGFMYLATLALPFVYFTLMHGGDSGQTVGKRALGIRVVDESGGSIGYGRAFGRYAITFLFGLVALPLLLDYLWPLWDRKHQALHDKVVGSVVVRA